MKALPYNTSIYLILFYLAVRGSCSIAHLELVMPRYATQGGSVALRCNHSVSPEQLYKVEWRRGDRKLFQYIKGRRPPFKQFPVDDALLDLKNSSQHQIVLSNLDFGASGTYTCVVSTEAPIYTKESVPKLLTIIDPQKADPIITFNKETYEVGELLEANCTSSPARPPPHITWFINDEKVDDARTRSFSETTAEARGRGALERKAASVRQLAVEVAELHAGEDGKLRLSCVSSIPGFVAADGDYADRRISTVEIIIDTTEGPPPSEPEAAAAASSTKIFPRFFIFCATYVAFRQCCQHRHYL